MCYHIQLTFLFLCFISSSFGLSWIPWRIKKCTFRVFTQDTCPEIQDVKAPVFGGFSGAGHCSRRLWQTDGGSLAVFRGSWKLNLDRLKGMLWFVGIRVMVRKRPKGLQVIPLHYEHMRTLTVLKLLLEFPSTTLSRGITLRSEGPRCICFSPGPSLPSFLPSLSVIY